MKNSATLPSIKNGGILQNMFSVDLRTLALFRVCLGLLVLHEFLSALPNVTAFYSDTGVLPMRIFLPGDRHYYQLSLFSINGTTGSGLLILLFGSLCAMAFIAGWKTRAANFWMWFILLSMHGRNPFIIEGFDVYVRFLLFWSLFIPMDQKYAWDAPQSQSKKIELSFATFALMMNVCILYLFMAYFKYFNAEWLSGQAVQYSLQVANTAKPLGKFLLNFPSLLVLLTYGTLFLETLGPVMLLIPYYSGYFRAAALAAFTCLQLGFMTTMDLLNFPFASIISTIPFIPSSWWTVLGSYGPTKRAGDIAVRLLTRPSFLGSRPYHGRIESAARTSLNFAALFFILMVIYLNIVSAKPQLRIPKPIICLEKSLGLYQKWTAYSPPGHFYNSNYWIVIVGTLKDGTQVDILRKKDVDWSNPEIYYKAYGGSRWKLYLMQALTDPKQEKNRIFLLHYLCREWDAQNAEERHVAKAEIYLVGESIRPIPVTLTRKVLQTHTPRPYKAIPAAPGEVSE